MHFRSEEKGKENGLIQMKHPAGLDWTGRVLYNTICNEKHDVFFIIQPVAERGFTPEKPQANVLTALSIAFGSCQRLNAAE